MRISPYPLSFAEISQWCRENEKTTSEGNTRFMEFVVLSCIASGSVTSRSLVFKGGNALRFAHQSPRSTKDLDFTADANEFPDDQDQIRKLIDDALRFAERKFNVKARCQRVRRNPQRPDATRQTYDIGVGYQFPTDRYFNSFEERVVSSIIPIEISFNDCVCEFSGCPGVAELKVCVLEDILAEKLRSLLQQRIRKRNRCQDVYDISRNTRDRNIDREKIGRYLLEKAAAREIVAKKSAFDDVIRDMALKDYDQQIMEQAPKDFIPFDMAWADVIALVDSLNIPS